MTKPFQQKPFSRKRPCCIFTGSDCSEVFVENIIQTCSQVSSRGNILEISWSLQVCEQKAETFGGRTVRHGDVQVPLPGHLARLVDGMLRCKNTTSLQFRTWSNSASDSFKRKRTIAEDSCCLHTSCLQSMEVLLCLQTCGFNHRKIKNFARCHFKPLWVVMSNFHWAETKFTFWNFFFLTAQSWAQSFGRKRTTAWHGGCACEVIVNLNCEDRNPQRGRTTFQVATSERNEARGDEVVHVWTSNSQVVFPVMTWWDTKCRKWTFRRDSSGLTASGGWYF